MSIFDPLAIFGVFLLLGIVYHVGHRRGYQHAVGQADRAIEFADSVMEELEETRRYASRLREVVEDQGDGWKVR